MITTMSAEQVMLQDMLQRLLRERKAPGRLPDEFTAEWDAEFWQGLTDLGVPALLSPEQADALGGGMTEAMLVQQELGRAGCVAPFLCHSVLAMLALRGSTAPEASHWIERMEAGEVLLTVAFDDAASRYSWYESQSRVRQIGGSFYVKGDKVGVQYGRTAAGIVTNARFDDGEMGLFLVPAMALSLTRNYRGVHGAPMSDLHLPGDGSAAVLLARGAAAETLLETLRGWNIAGLCAAAVGAMQAACDLTAGYLGERKQFGQRLGQFQVLRHRFIDMRIHLLKAESMAALAASRAEERDSPQRREGLAAAKLIVDQAGRFVSQQAVHLHGAIGMTAEYELGSLVRLLTAIGLQAGDADYHIAALGS